MCLGSESELLLCTLTQGFALGLGCHPVICYAHALCDRVDITLSLLAADTWTLLNAEAMVREMLKPLVQLRAGKNSMELWLPCRGYSCS